MEPLETHAGRLLAALAFFTRLPLPAALARRAASEPDLVSAAPMFPLAGALIGAAGAVLLLIATQFLPTPVAVALALAFGLLLTGALHEDGLADCADAFGTTVDREATLEIMRDSRIGAFGAVALMISLLLRWTALSAMTASGAALALIVAHGAARGAVALAPWLTGYARREGAGSLLAAGIDERQFGISAAIALAVGLVFGGWAGLFAAALGFVAAGIVLAYAQARVGGYTGDVLGAMEQVAEIAIVCALAGFWAA